ncbi:c-type cytochrome [Pedobacter psychroterrae]|uniref:Cytochrome c n=1 Tax=Pedobacter psychroterrae TaxID=2530453 RepID=A0A4R0NDL9_9SPHI|nr:cytochrome c [Pedobacter psychroterrae]TCC97353.1 cytochrome c [Pedobacter psychroterrae]
MRKPLLAITFLITIACVVYSCQNAGQLQQDVYYVNGRDLYIRHCQNCHGANGEGLALLAPPLTDTTSLKDNKSKIACFIKNGISDTTMIIAGKKYDGKMPDFNFANIDIAQLVVYITNTFGNKQGMYSPEQVAKDLKNCQ